MSWTGLPGRGNVYADLSLVRGRGVLGRHFLMSCTEGSTRDFKDLLNKHFCREKKKKIKGLEQLVN